MEPLISVIVPIYNVEPYLRKCVDSILNQTYQNLEVILVDDGSPDQCPEICDEYAEMDRRVKVVHKKNGGLSDARNVGMGASSGEYLSFVDSDDLLPEDAIENLVRIALEESADIVVGGYERFADEPKVLFSQKEEVMRCTPEEAMADMFRNGCASWARLYRREIHLPVLFPVGEINEDEAIVLKLLERCKCVVTADLVVYHYRCRPESITTAAFSPKKLAWAKHCKDNLEFIRENYPQLELDAAARYRSSLLWALREIALSEGVYDEEVRQLKHQMRAHKALFAKAAYKNSSEQFSYLMMQKMPFPAVKAILRLRHGK